MAKVKGPAKRRKIGNVFRYVVIGIALTASVFPFAWILMSSFKQPKDIATIPPKVLFSPTLENYTRVWSEGFYTPLMNSLIVSCSSVAIAITLGTLAGYALSRFKTPGTKAVLATMLVTRFLPWIAFALPVFLIMNSLRLTGTLLSLILAYLVFNLPLSVWLMRSFFDQIPIAFEESAMVEGCSRLGAFLRVVLPLIATPLIAVMILTLIFSWNHFLFALILGGRQAETLPIALRRYVGGPDWGIEWGALAAASVLVITPIVLISLVLSKYLVKGLTGGTVEL